MDPGAAGPRMTVGMVLAFQKQNPSFAEPEGTISHEGGAVTALQTFLAVSAPNRAPLVFLCGEEAFRKANASTK